jgi:protein O-mannosyl-transferase
MAVIGSTPADPAQGRRSLIPLPAACAAVLAVLVYLNALHGPFVYDDFRLIVENPSLDIRNPLAVVVHDITRPVVNLSYAIDTMLWGRTPLGYHVTNVLLHAVNVVLVFWVAFLVTEDRARRRAAAAVTASPSVIGFATAALFAVHPMMTEAVGYISGRSEVAYATSFLLAFLAGRRWMIEGGRRWWAACVALWAVSLLTKESAAVLPVLLLAYDWFVLRADWPERRRRLMRLQLPMIAAMVLAGAVRVAVLKLVEYPGRPGADWRYALVAVDVFWRYLWLFFAPRGQAIFHAVPVVDSAVSIRAIGGVLGLAAFLGLAWALRRMHGVITFGLLWFAVLLLPSAVLFTLGRGEAMAEHRAYLPAAGLFLLWACAFGTVWAGGRRKRIRAAAAAIVFLTSLAFLTLVRNVIWHDPVALTREAARLAPGQWIPRVLVGEAFRQSGRCEDAVAEYRAAIDMRPQEEFPYTGLARCLVEEHRLGEAEQVLRKLHTINPRSQDAAMGLGLFALLDGRLADSRAFFNETLDREPSRPRSLLLLAFIDGTLTPDQHQRVCEELRMLAGPAVKVAACGAETLQEKRDSAVSSDR